MIFRSSPTPKYSLHRKQTKEEKIEEQLAIIEGNLQRHAFTMFFIIIILMLIIFVLSAWMVIPRMESTIYYNGGLI